MSSSANWRSLFMISSCGNMSNAFDRSIDTNPTIFWLSSSLSQFSVKQSKAVSHLEFSICECKLVKNVLKIGTRPIVYKPIVSSSRDLNAARLYNSITT